MTVKGSPTIILICIGVISVRPERAVATMITSTTKTKVMKIVKYRQFLQYLISFSGLLMSSLSLFRFFSSVVFSVCILVPQVITECIVLICFFVI